MPTTPTPHTPLPWRLEDHPDGPSIIGPDQDGCHLYVCDLSPHGQAAANGQFIVRACNAHDDMLAALRHARNAIESLRIAARTMDTSFTLAACESGLDALCIIERSIAQAEVQS